MAKKMAVDYLSSLNAGSGLNTTQIVDSLVDAERAPRQEKIEKGVEAATVSISALGSLKSEIKAFQSNTKALIGETGIAMSSSNSAAITIAPIDSQTISTFNHNVEVSQLASNQVLNFSNFSSPTAFVNIDNLSIDFGSWTGSTFNDAASNIADKSISFVNDGVASPSLSEVRDAINNITDTSGNSIGVRADIIETTDGNYSLVVKSVIGAANSIRMKSYLSSSENNNLKYDPGNTSLSDAASQSITGQDAIFTVDGISITRSTNSIKDVLSGVQLDLHSTTTKAEAISSSYSNSGAYSVLESLVAEMNFISQLLREQTAPGKDGKDGGPLEGDLFVRGVKNRLSSMSTTPIPGFDNEDIYLSNFGVQTQLDGSLTINKATFDKYIAANPDHFRALTTSGVSTSVNGLTGSVLGANFTPGDYTFLLSGGTASLDGTTLLADTTGETNKYTSTSGSTAGVTVNTNLSSLSATVFVGKSFIENINEYLSAILSSSTQQGDIDSKIDSLRSEVEDYEIQLTDLNEEMERVRTTYREKFTAMEQAVAGFKKTGTFLQNMMDAWSASMK